MDEIGSAGLGSRLTFGGLATGLDTGALVDALMQAERRPLRLLESRLSQLSERQAALQTLSGRLLALRDAARALDNRSSGLTGASASEELLAYTATSSHEAVVRAEADASASPGVHALRVDALARGSRRVSYGYADPDASITSKNRTLTIDYGGTDILISVAKNTTLRELRDAINAHADNDGSVRAEMLYDGSAHRLVISGTKPGAANDVSVVTTLTGASGSGPFLDAGAGQSASDARLVYLGVSVSRGSNDVSDLVPGVTLHLLGTNDPARPAEQVMVEVARDDEAIEAKLQSLVDAYNAVRDFSLQQTTIDPETRRGGVLIGDPLLRNVEARLQSLLGGVRSFAGNPFASFGQLGIAFDDSGRLGLDGEKLRRALEQDDRAVRELLSGDGTVDGLATALARMLDPIVRPGDGLIELRGDGLAERIEDLKRQVERFEARMVTREETLVRRFSALESLVATLQGQAGFLSGFRA